ncbi:MAG: caspase family protein [Saprospiraceae bacterium]|nr:caspase family protein [Saprospiraceae bacterium]
MAASNPKFSERRAFIIGINAYEHVSTLETPINDGIALKKVLIEEFGYREAPVEACYNPNKKALLDFLAGMKKAVKDDDSVIFYFAGHGIARDETDGLKGFILPTDADLNDYDTLVSMQELFDVFSELPCRHFLLVLDCCFAGAFRWATKYRVVSSIIQEPISRQHYDHYTNHSAWQVITSASHTQKAIDLLGNRVEADGGNSPFAKLIMEGLRGKADFNGDHIITASELSTYVGDRLRSITSTQDHQAQSIGFFPLPKHGNGEFIFQPSKFEVQQLVERDYDNPYMGLEAYTNDALFFGREDATNELLEAIKKNKLTVVIGASGTGKSSLVKAGIIPKLEREGNIVKEMRPGKYPMSVLNSIDPFCEVLVIDQFEEVITQSVEKEATAFIDLLKSKVAEGKLTIILTLRIDFESQINIKGIEIQWKVGRFLVPPFSPEDLREIIVSPAARVGRFIESEKLVDKIISEVVHFPGSLPLLSFTLTELFEKCKKDGLYRGIRESDYEELGGISGALQNVADKVFAELNDPGKQLLKNFMFRMVSLSGGEIAGKRVMKEDLPEDTTKKIDAIINKLIEVRLILSDRDLNNGKIYYEPAHDALVRSWGQLLGWIKSFGEDNIFLLQKLSVAVEDHLKTGDEEHLWHRNANLEPTFTLKEKEEGLFNLKELDFLHKSKEKKVNEIEALKAERDEAVRQKELAEKKLREANNIALLIKISENDSTLAFRIAEYNLFNYSKNRSTLLLFSSLIRDQNVVYYKNWVYSNTQNGRVKLAVSKNHPKVLMYLGRHALGIWDVQTDEIIEIPIDDHFFPSALALSPNIDYFIYIEEVRSGGDFIFNIQKMIYWNFLESQSGSLKSAVFTNDGKFYTTRDKDGIVMIFKVNDNKPLKVIQEEYGGVIAISSDNKYFLASRDSDNSLRLYNFENGSFVKSFDGHHDTVSSAAFLADSNQLISAGRDNNIILWDIESGKILKIFSNFIHGVNGVDFSPNGKYVIVDKEKTAIIQDIESENTVLTLSRGHLAEIHTVAFLPDGRSFLTVGFDNYIRFWEWPNEVGIKSLVTDSEGSIVRISNDKKMIAFNGVYSRVLIYNVDNFEKIYLLKNESNNTINAFEFTPDSKYLVAGCKDGSIRVWSLVTYLAFFQQIVIAPV